MKREKRKIKFYLFGIFLLASGIGLFSFPVKMFAGQTQNMQSLSAEKIEQLGIDYMVEHHFLPDEDAKIEVDYMGQDVVLPTGSLDFNIKMTQNNPNASRIPLLMTINVDGIFRRGLWMTAYIKSYKKIVKTLWFTSCSSYSDSQS